MGNASPVSPNRCDAVAGVLGESERCFRLPFELTAKMPSHFPRLAAGVLMQHGHESAIISDRAGVQTVNKSKGFLGIVRVAANVCNAVDDDHENPALAMSARP